jgi:hypothetical protein
MRRSTPIRILLLGAAVALVAAVVRALRGAPTTAFGPPADPTSGVLVRAGDAPAESEPQPSTSTDAPLTASPTPAGEPATPRPPGERWVFPVDGGCPPTHPIKAKLRSGLYHLPGMAAYSRTIPDRCYAHEVDAEADGLRRAKR